MSEDQKSAYRERLREKGEAHLKAYEELKAAEEKWEKAAQELRDAINGK